jgi:hypothetical protein
MKFVEDVKQAWKWFSVQAMVLAGAIQGAWIFVPDDMKASIPANLMQGVTVGLLVLGVVGRITDQSPK